MQPSGPQKMSVAKRFDHPRGGLIWVEEKGVCCIFAIASFQRIRRSRRGTIRAVLLLDRTPVRKGSP
jgi:hypothetical protein